MKKTGKRLFALLLALLTVFTGLPLTAVQAEAASGSLSDYSASAAVQWAKDHWNDIDSIIFGKGYYYSGGDCANFVAQCLYMGGLDMNAQWNYSGYSNHYSGTNHWTRASGLYEYVTGTLGAKSIRDPSASQIKPGDLLFFRQKPNLRISHSAIVISVDNGVPTLAAHSTTKNGSPDRYTSSNWHLSFRADCTYLVQMNGSVCTAPNPRSFDVYVPRSGDLKLHREASSKSGYTTKFLSNEYAHVYQTKKAGGVTWGYTFRYGNWGWINLGSFTYKRHVESYKPSHQMGNWYVSKKAFCVEKGEERRDCQRCDYFETRDVNGTGHRNTTKADCYNPSYCTDCGAQISPALGHSFGNWTQVTAATCTAPGSEKRVCTRCGKTETRTVNALGHNYRVELSSPTCTDNGTSTVYCTRCGDRRTSYTDPSNTWSAWTTENKTVPAGKKQSKVQYRYRDKMTTTSSSPTLSGWTQTGKTWKQSGSGSIDYVTGWPSGYDKSNTYYIQYNKTPKTASETTTAKTTVSTSTVNYLNWHWCRGDHAGLGNHKIQREKMGEWTTFHAYVGGKLTYDSHYDACKSSMGNVCDSTYWWQESIPIYRCTYVDYTAEFSYEKWGNWSAWQDSAVSSSSTRQVETQTLYRYDLGALGHDFSVDNANSRKEPTCTEPGYQGKVCSRCGAVSPDTTVLPALGHNLGQWRVVSTTTDGNKTITIERKDCQRTGCTYHEIRVKESSSTVYTYKNTVAPTCTAQGYDVYVSGSTTLRINYTPALGHQPNGDWVTVREATCQEDGLRQCKCVRHDDGKTCNYVYSEPIPMLQHTPETIARTEPTCETDGNEAGEKCAVCGEILKDPKPIPALGHNGKDENGNEVWVVESEPGCGTDGVRRLYCVRVLNGEVCHHLIKEETIPGIEAFYVEKFRQEPTCAECGWVEYVCENCAGTEDEHGYTEILDKTEHTWGEWKTIEEPYCIYDGEQMRECLVCHEQEFAILDAPYTEHDLQTQILPSTCVSDGIRRTVCTRCDYVENESGVAPLGHDVHRNAELSRPATCTEPGLDYFECQRDGCEYFYTVELDALGHDCVAGETVPPTCVEPGFTRYVCQRDGCDYEYQDDNEQPLGHDLGAWYTQNAPLCLENGQDRRDCNRCDYFELRYPQPLGHVSENFYTVDREPTCTEPGVRSHHCARCDTPLDSADIPALGHEWSDWFTVRAATYTEPGLERRECIRRDVFEERETPILEKLKATFVADDEVVAVVEFEKGVRSLNEPDVPEKFGFSGEWEPYELQDKDIIIHAVYSYVDKSEQIETTKTAEFDPATGTARISLRASSDAKSVVTQNSRATPLDIVLVVDQSGSMEGKKLRDLKAAASDFAQSVFEDARDKNVEHRMAIVGFAMGADRYSRDFPALLNTEILTTGGAPVQYGNTVKPSVYRDAMVAVNQNGAVNGVITKAIGNIEAKGATEADLGLTMANNIFANNDPIEADRQRIVVFMTDGEPTDWSDYNETVATAAVKQAYQLKNTYHAFVYSVGVESNTTNTNRFLDYVSSNCPDAQSMRKAGTRKENKFSISVDNSSALTDVFRDIVTESVTNTTDFKNVTLIDTVSAYFTLTKEQETRLRQSAIRMFGIENEDITVERHENGTTTVTIAHIEPKEVSKNGKTTYVAEFSFEVSPNGNSFAQGSYPTNTTDAGVRLGDNEAYEDVFPVPEVEIDRELAIVVFTINGEPYLSVATAPGTPVGLPDYTAPAGSRFSGWTLPEDFTAPVGETVFDARLTDKLYTVTWRVGDRETTEQYGKGDFIVAPEVEDISLEQSFVGWDHAIPMQMPAEDLTFTAVFGAHKHRYVTSIVKPVSCLEDGVTRYTCACGDSYEEALKASGTHTFVAITGEPAVKDLSSEEFRCSVCGAFMSRKLVYKLTANLYNYRAGYRAVDYELDLQNAEGKYVQPEQTVQIVLPVPTELRDARTLRLFRIEADGSETELPIVVEDGMITFETDHFCTYVFAEECSCAADGVHPDEDMDKHCDICDVYLPSDLELYRCKMCPAYEAMKDVPFVGVFYRLVHFFVHIAHYISHLT